MKAFIAATGLAVGASAAVVGRGDQCCFELTASGGASGTISQLSDGQNRIGGEGPPATYCISNGGITDSMGRGCILTPPTTQFQCDVGATPTTGFSISLTGNVLYEGSDVFYACPATDTGMYNIYSKSVANQSKCVEVMLSTGGKCLPAKPVPTPSMYTCPAPSTVTVTEKAKPWYTTVTVHEKCPGPMTSTTTCFETVTEKYCPTSPVAPPPPPPETTYYTTKTKVAPPPPPETTTPPPETKPKPPPYKPSPPASMPPSPPPTKPTGSSCPTDLTGPYQFPHLIVPVSSSQPDHAYGTQYNATITPSECTIFNFDIPYDYKGKSCSTIFLFPEQSQLETSSFDISGTGSLVFSSLSSAANQQTTWNNCPAKASQLGSVSPVPGNSYSISTGSCAAGTTQSIEVCGTGSLSLSFFEDYNPSPIGVYITSC